MKGDADKFQKATGRAEQVGQTNIDRLRNSSPTEGFGRQFQQSACPRWQRWPIGVDRRHSESIAIRSGQSGFSRDKGVRSWPGR